MLGPLPTIYKVLVSVIAFLAFAGLGAWIGWVLPDSTLAAIGTDLGIALGTVAVALLLLHQGPRRRSGSGARVRARRP